jgi:hypothetical protein
MEQPRSEINCTSAASELLSPSAIKALTAGWELADAAETLLAYLQRKVDDDLGRRLVNKLSRWVTEYGSSKRSTRTTRPKTQRSVARSKATF